MMNRRGFIKERKAPQGKKDDETIYRPTRQSGVSIVGAYKFGPLFFKSDPSLPSLPPYLHA
jgi:hypothetical protein